MSIAYGHSQQALNKPNRSDFQIADGLNMKSRDKSEGVSNPMSPFPKIG